ncbi:MAG: adenosylcobinamide-GDP ribazoletransferase [Acidimicrobiia bacterium]
MKGFLSAAAFLTRVPVPGRVHSLGQLGGAILWFPVVGAGIGLLVGAVALAGFVIGVPSHIASGVAVAVSLLVTGAFHEDGLADTFDGLGSGRRGLEAIELMRDPRIGVFGAAALLLSIFLQIATLGSLTRSTVVGVTVAAHAASRGFTVLAMYLPLASDTGLAAGYHKAAPPGARPTGFIVGLAIAVAILRENSWILLVAQGTGALLALWAHRRIGGMTGDVLGAVQQVTMATILVGATARW